MGRIHLQALYLVCLQGSSGMHTLFKSPIILRGTEPYNLYDYARAVYRPDI